MEKMNVYYWDRRPGFFVDMKTGEPRARIPFTGNTVEWYLTLLETIRSIRGEDYNVLLTSPDICTILECLVQYRPIIDFDKNEYVCEKCDFVKEKIVKKLNYKDFLFEKQGTLMNDFVVYKNKNPFFPRNKIILVNDDLKNPIVLVIKGLSILD